MKFLTNIVKGLTIGFLLATTACQSEWEDLDLSGTEEAEVAGEVIEITYRGQSVTVRQVGDQYIADGDMILYPDSKKMETTNAKTAGVGVNPDGDAFSPDILWPNNTVPYTIDPELIATYERTGLRNPEVIREAMSHIAEETNVRFVERTSEEDYITFLAGSTSRAVVGHKGNQQFVELSLAADFIVVVHEICHALGMYHEQSRLDRDNFIRIDRTNITGGDAFAQLTDRLAKDYTNYFDFESVMLYGSYSNAQDRSRPTMTKLDGSTFEGYSARSGLSAGDIATLNAMYPEGGNRPPEDPPVDTSPTLPDVPGNWAESEIRYMLTNNLMAGYVDNTFRPTREVTRAEFATMIRSALNPSVSGDPAVANRSFSDIAPHWAYSNILAVARAGFLSGYPDGTFKPDDNISRQEMIVSLANGLGLPGASPSVLSIFSDRSDILSWAASPVANATAQGFIANYPVRSQLRPTANATRADVTVILYQVLRYQGRAPALANEYLVRP